MLTHKTLPCFSKNDFGARSGGFISDRYLYGLKAPEYFFHGMAGRDGLVDTAIKTAKCGYLQRSLVKSLESIKVHYDNTVRDDSCGSIIQLKFGEDGLDVKMAKFLKQFDVIAQKSKPITRTPINFYEVKNSKKKNYFISNIHKNSLFYIN